MATLLIRNLNDSVKETIRVRAARHGRSMEAEARAILTESTLTPKRVEPEEHLWFRVRRLVDKYGGLDIDLPPREMDDRPPDFS